MRPFFYDYRVLIDFLIVNRYINLFSSLYSYQL
ncbi:hypothetical protein VPHK9_0077 [Vibrio phage K9]